MEHPIILVADGDPKNLQILRESLEAASFGVVLAADGMQAWQKCRDDAPDLVLAEVNLPKLDGFQLLEKLKSDAITSSIPLVFLTNRREIQDRVRSLRGGVKDYMIKPLHVKEVIARIRMILRRMERVKEDEVDANRKLVGRLEELSVVELIESFGVERKTGILTLHNEHNRVGEIYFRDGAVINAALSSIKAEKAVYRMLPWRRGHFTMLFRDVNVSDDISVSNLGLLLQGFKRIEERERLFKQLPSPEATFVTTDEFRKILAKREITTDVAKFIALIDGKRDILQIIEESTYDDLKALERLVKLYRQGFIKPDQGLALPPEEDVDITTSIAEPPLVNYIAKNGDSRQKSAVKPANLERRAKPTTTPSNGPSIPPGFRETIKPIEPIPALTPMLPDFDVPEEIEPAPDILQQIERSKPKTFSPPPTVFDLPVSNRNREPALPAEDDSLPIDFQIEPELDRKETTTAFEPEKPVEILRSNRPASPRREIVYEPPAPPPAKPSPLPVRADPITENLLKLVNSNPVKSPKLAVLGRVGQQVEKLLLTLLGPESRTKKVESATFQHFEIGERRLGDGQFEIIGLSMEQQFTRLLDTVANHLVGYILLVEAHRKDDVEYLSYLLSTLKPKYRLPMGIAVIKSATEKNLGIDALRDLLGAEADDYMRECDPSEVSSIIEFWTGFCADGNLRRRTPPEMTGTS